MRSETCSRCGEEVRYGARGTTTGWLHREDGDHVAILGYIATAEDKARWDAELDVERTRVVTKSKGKGDNKVYFEEEETYTARTYSLKGDALKAANESDDDEEEDEAPDEIPAPEIPRHDLKVEDFPPRSGIRQILNTITKADGWELRRLTGSRGPYLGSKGKVLSISDSVLINARGPAVDGGVALAVASWRDGAFDFAYTGVLKDGVVTTTAANSTALKAWIKETPP